MGRGSGPATRESGADAPDSEAGTESAGPGAEADAETAAGDTRAQTRASATSTPLAERVFISSPPKPHLAIAEMGWVESYQSLT